MKNAGNAGGDRDRAADDAAGEIPRLRVVGVHDRLLGSKGALWYINDRNGATHTGVGERTEAEGIRVSKLDAARRQLDCAIELWFADKDAVSTHGLAAAAHQIIHDTNRKKGGPDLADRR